MCFFDIFLPKFLFLSIFNYSFWISTKYINWPFLIAFFLYETLLVDVEIKPSSSLSS
ncbi:hypothetical protein Fmac_014711 [Flemingia macrophylla]|uniref:Uncharacterized protein n=1 Tax=Flemingia macrophylla TaxID=520843 RepID=A0ABD1MD84_9FABA